MPSQMGADPARQSSRQLPPTRGFVIPMKKLFVAPDAPLFLSEDQAVTAELSSQRPNMVRITQRTFHRAPYPSRNMMISRRLDPSSLPTSGH